MENKYYIAMDGGGTKLQGILFDGQYRLISTAKSEGTHLSVYSEQAVREHIKECYGALFRGVQGTVTVERLYTICGNNELFASMLPEGVKLEGSLDIGEPLAALFAGTGNDTGFAVIAGTGSDVFALKDGKVMDSVGGFGAILGDEGSGVWTARMAMQAAIRAEEGWGEPTLFLEILKEHYGFSNLWEYVDYLYASPAPFRRLGDVLPLAAKAALQSDILMCDIFSQSGVLLAKQTSAVLRRNPDIEPLLVACGGAWKADVTAGNIMSGSFLREVKKEFPNARFCFPRFEHIMAGPVCLAKEQAREKANDPCPLMDILACNFPELIWNRTNKQETV